MPTTVLIARDGQLGGEILRQLEAAGDDVVAPELEECDINSWPSVERYFARFDRVDRIFNAAAYTAVDAAEEDGDAAFQTNAMGAARLAAMSRHFGAKLVYFSTDYVFGHGHKTLIDESAQPDPLSVYGASKWQGEVMSLENNPATFVMRTSGLYSPGGNNFVRTMLRVGKQGRALSIVDDEVVSPTWVTPLARVAIDLSRTELFGTYHATSHGGCTWFEFAGAIFEKLGMKVDLSPTDSASWGAPAKRPAYSMLDNRNLRLVGLDHFEHWRRHLEQFLDLHANRLLEEV
ncbi:MAG: dTDP-4-dehydrorhamnose reductase [Bradymonadaceae bacterium]